MLAELYRFPLSDESRAIWARARGSNAGASTAVTASWTNDQQLPLFVANLGVICTGGAAQFVIHWSLTMQDPDSSVTSALTGGDVVEATVAVIRRFGYAPRNLVVPPRWRISAFGTFNAGAASNTVTVDVLGWYIPRGTLALP